MGRLDVETTGLLLLTDDGKFAHRITSPKQLKTKVYHVTCKHPVEEQQIAAFLRGVTLKDEPVTSPFFFFLSFFPALTIPSCPRPPPSFHRCMLALSHRAQFAPQPEPGTPGTATRRRGHQGARMRQNIYIRVYTHINVYANMYVLVDTLEGTRARIQICDNTHQGVQMRAVKAELLPASPVT